jgi:hypothetical protein
MARIRSIKPEFWTSEQVVECSTNARLLFVGMWNFCDDAGRHPYSPRRLKMCVFPGDDHITTDVVGALMGELVTAKLIRPYVVNGEMYFAVSGWSHQKIDRPQPTKWPGPDEGEFVESADTDSTNARRTLDDHSSLIGKEGIGEERKGKEGIPPKVPQGGRAYSKHFLGFWEAYPRKEGKQKAHRYWRTAVKQVCIEKGLEPQEAADFILEAANEFAGSVIGSGDYCPHPSTWLNQGRYDDDRSEWNRSREPARAMPAFPQLSEDDQ